MDIRSSLITNLQTAILVEPGIGPLHNPTMLAQAVISVDPAPRDPWRDAAFAKIGTTLARVIAFVGIQFLRAAARPSALAVANVWDRRDACGQHLALAPVIEIESGVPC